MIDDLSEGSEISTSQVADMAPLVLDHSPTRAQANAIPPPRNLYTDIREVLHAFYMAYNPEKVSTIELILDKYRGNELQLVQHLKEKYEIGRFEPFDKYMESQRTPVSAVEKVIRTGVVVGNVSAKSDSPLPQRSNSSNNAINTKPYPANVNAASPLLPSIPALNVTDIAGLSNDFASRFMTGWNNMTNVSPNQSESSRSYSIPEPPPSISNYNLSPKTPSRTPALDTTVSSSSQDTNSQVNNDINDMSTKVKVLEETIIALELEKSSIDGALRVAKSQIASLKSENSKLKQDYYDLTNRLDSTSKSVVHAVERESTTQRDVYMLQEKLRLLEISKREVEEQLDLSTRQANTKHKQLVDTIALTHRLGAQLRYLSMKAFQVIEEQSSASASQSNDELSNLNSRYCNDCVKYGILCNKLGVQSLPKAVDINNIQDKEGSGNEQSLDSIIVDVNYSTESVNTSTDINPDDAEVTIDQQASLIRDLRAMVKSLHSAFISGRVELRIAIQEQTLNARRTAEQQQLIEDLQLKLKKLANELNSASGSNDSMKKQISEANNEIENFKLKIAELQERERNLESSLQASKSEVAALKDTLLAANDIKRDLVSIYGDHIKVSERSSMDYIRSLSERLLLEREDTMTKMITVFEHDKEVRGIFQLEIQREMHRLREELLKSKRAEAQREREMAFLQTQLIDAVERISNQDAKVKELLDAKKQLEELQGALSAAAASSSAAANSIKVFNAWKPKLNK